MFQNQNKTNLNQDKNLKIEDFPIHTMKKDLQDIADPAQPLKSASAESLSPPAPPKQEALNEVQKTSPFLQKLTAQEEPSRPKSQPPSSLPIRPEAALSSSTNPIKEFQNIIQPSQPVRLGKILNIATIAAVILLVLGGAYYAWSTDSFSSFSTSRIISVLGIGSSPKDIPDNDTDIPPVEEPPISENSPVNVPKYSVDKPNYLSIDTENANKEKIGETLKKYANEINDLKLSTPVEFIAVDLQNNPLTFSDFAVKTGIKLSDSSMSQLENIFSLFIYSDKGIPKIGISIPAKNDAKLKESMQSSEKNLIEGVRPLFLSKEFSVDNKAFGTSTYRQTSIRYKNLSTPQELSVDYSIINNKLMIGTSKMTLRAIIDYLNNK